MDFPYFAKDFTAIFIKQLFRIPLSRLLRFCRGHWGSNISWRTSSHMLRRHSSVWIGASAQERRNFVEMSKYCRLLFNMNFVEMSKYFRVLLKIRMLMLRSYGSSTIVSNGSWSWCLNIKILIFVHFLRVKKYLILLWGRLARLSCKLNRKRRCVEASFLKQFYAESTLHD